MEVHKDMKDEKLLNILCQERMASALELSLKSCERYKKAEQEADRKMEYVFKMGLDINKSMQSTKLLLLIIIAMPNMVKLHICKDSVMVLTY